MASALCLPRRTLIAWRRAASAALLALQVTVAGSSVFERQLADQPTVHAHDQETRHLFPHDESSCGLCAARTLVADVPRTAALLTTDLVAGRSVIAQRTTPPARAPRTANASRAPPLLT